jgi:hypothetical protein
MVDDGTEPDRDLNGESLDPMSDAPATELLTSTADPDLINNAEKSPAVIQMTDEHKEKANRKKAVRKPPTKATQEAAPAPAKKSVSVAKKVSAKVVAKAIVDKAIVGKSGKKAPKQCLCGCREMTRGGMFKPGHDARFFAAQKKAGKATKHGK